MRWPVASGVLPVSDYTATFRVTAVGKDSARVTWSGAFKRKDTGARPANDATAIKTISSVYQSGLDNLDKLIEAK